MLSRLWSPSNLLVQNITFHPGLNLIIGRYSSRARKQGINGIGKSSVVRLIDFLLLSDSAEKIFAQNRYSFLRSEEHVVCLELVFDGIPLRLQRAFKEPSVVGISRANEREYFYSKEEARDILDGICFPRTESRQLPGNRYRSLMQFFIKDDLKNQKRLDPIAFVAHGGANANELTALNLFLLGLPNSSLILLNLRRSLVDTQRRDREAIVKRVEEVAGKSLAELRTEIASREREVTSLREALGDLNLLEDFQRVSQRLAVIEEKISELRQAVDRGDRQLAKLKQFTHATKDVDVNDVAEQYKLISSVFGDLVRRSLEEVLSFRESMASERRRFHGRKYQELEQIREETLRQLAIFEAQRAALLRALQPSEPGVSLQDAVQRLVERKLEVDRIAQAVNDIGEMDSRLNQMEFDADTARHQAIGALNEVEAQIQSIRELFVEIVEQALSLSDVEREGAFIDITTQPQAKGSRPPIKIDVQVPRSDALGHARLRLVAYDLTVFLHAVDSRIPLPRFLVHDGAFHGISRRTVVRALNYIHTRALGDPTFQYIATFNEDELDVHGQDRNRDGSFCFDVHHVTSIALGDAPEEMLFARHFT